MMRGLLAELGIAIPEGLERALLMARQVVDGEIPDVPADPRLVGLLARKPVRVATVAMANKMARIAWAIMTWGEVYQARYAPMLATI